jgi:hypothetical protein
MPPSLVAVAGALRQVLASVAMAVLAWIAAHKQELTLGTLAAILAILEKLTGWGRRAFLWVWTRRAAASATGVPKRTITAVPQAEAGHPFWSPATHGDGRNTTQLSGSFAVTNVSNRSVRLVRVEVAGGTSFASVYVPRYGRYTSDHALDPHEITSMTFTVFADHLAPVAGKPQYLDVHVTDNFGNRHRIRKVRFNSTVRPQVMAEPEGDPHLGGGP